jgi:hypothetical protein
MKRLTAIAIVIIFICGIYQKAHAKWSSGGRGGFSSLRLSLSIAINGYVIDFCFS